MRGNELLNKIELIDPAFVEDADVRPKAKKRRITATIAAAACLCLAAVCGIFALKKASAPNGARELDKITISEFVYGGFGFEGYLCYDASELDGGNPWNGEAGITKLPVYRNKAYDPSGAGVPRGLDEEEMRTLLGDAASKLGIEILSVETIAGEAYAGDSAAAEIHAKTTGGVIYVMANSRIIYFLPDGGLELPDKYGFTNSETGTSEAQESIEYLCEKYGDFLGLEKPAAVSWGDRDFDGVFHRRYSAYDLTGDITQDILNYNMCRVSFSSSDDGKLIAVTIGNVLKTAEKTGDYPIISVSDAKKRLIAGNYQTSVPGAMPGEGYIAKAELIYRVGALEEMLIPYYRFYVLLPDMDRDNGLHCYGAYYVPAVAEEYIANMPVYDGRFN